MSHDEEISNKSSNRPFNEVLGVYASRRKVLMGSLTLAAGSFLSGGSALAALGGNKQSADASDPFSNGLCNFTPVPVASGTGPVPQIAEEYEYQVLIPWGTAINGGASYDGDPRTRPTAQEQASQIGIGHDGMCFFPYGRYRSDRGVLAINHEFGGNRHVLPPHSIVEVDRAGQSVDLPVDLEATRLSQHAHGVSVVEISRNRGRWWLVNNSPFSRRIHVNTEVEFSGPVAGTELIDSGLPTLGTVNNCGNGSTPWGTYLTCEENFNGYFAATDPDWVADEMQNRYGITARGFDYGWEIWDPRFDLSQPGIDKEANRFGWIVEIDPMAPSSKPVKRTALGRFKHEGCALTVGRGGRVVAYMGDDQQFDYIYKFVSQSNWKSMRAQGMSPLDHGSLYVARFNDDGSGDWLELTIDNPLLAARFASQAEVLTYTRVAADLLGATPMDRPEWTTVAPNGDVYCTLTNNSRRTEANAANPLAPNADGHIIRWRDKNRHLGDQFEWDIFILAEDTHGDGDERTFSDPDGLWADPDGRLFIQTDGGQKKGLNNQMLVASIYDEGAPGELEVKRLFTGVTGDEITGITVTPDRRTMFINTQHPGNGDPALTNFPAAEGSGKIPRDCTFVITRKDGGIIGS